ncbi:unnamed protein product [Rotaria sp. Silwood1]|nr:unnamed protein product [Rotaria sp. Silwood1]CAF4965857.1 unnamed protein product [Rotaria sp. Silwood1]
MASKPSTKVKTSTIPKTNSSTENNEQMVLVREETSDVLLIIEYNKVSSINKVSKLVPGITVTCQNSSRERWRGTILAMGTEADCLKVMSMIEKDLQSTNNDTAESKTKENQKLQSTISIESKSSENVQFSEDHEDDIELSSALHIIEEEEKDKDDSLMETTDTSAVSTNSNDNKRSAEEDTNISHKRKKYSNYGLTVPYATNSAKEKECLYLQAQVNRYKQEWMRKQ